MCIRDRTLQARLHDGGQVITYPQLAELVQLQPSPPKVVVPVSYTHLRAHETVLDLVCRLLLEKKKQQTDARRVRHYKQIMTQTDCRHAVTETQNVSYQRR